MLRSDSSLDSFRERPLVISLTMPQSIAPLRTMHWQHALALGCPLLLLQCYTCARARHVSQD